MGTREKKAEVKALRSMSGHGEAQARSALAAVSVRVRSYNHRSRDIVVRVTPEEWDGLAPDIEQCILSRVERGVVHCRVEIKPLGSWHWGAVIDRKALRNYVARLKELGRELSVPVVSSAAEVLKFPGVLIPETRTGAPEKLRRLVIGAVRDALDKLTAAREFEGRRMHKQLQGLLRKMEKAVDRIARQAPRIVENYRRRLKQRLRSVGEGDEKDAALEREVVLMAERSDISEELVRLQSHISHAYQTLQAGGVCGRKLDFLAQEMAREINTIAAKARDVKMGRIAVDFRLWVEQFREQVQNLE